MPLWVSDQARHKTACTATETSWVLEILAIASRDIILSEQRTTKALIRLRGCAVWSAPLLFAYDIRHIFSWPGSYRYGGALYTLNAIEILLLKSMKIWKWHIILTGGCMLFDWKLKLTKPSSKDMGNRNNLQWKKMMHVQWRLQSACTFLQSGQSMLWFLWKPSVPPCS